MREIENTLQKLKSSPLFYLFVSSRELFHSNFWYWLSKLNPHATADLFSVNKNSDKTLHYHREYNKEYKLKSTKIKSKTDLYITDSKNFNIVIENKVKDFPKTEQLDRIVKSFSDTKSNFVLVTLFNSDDIKFKGWKTLTYKDISKKIKADDFTQNEYYKNLINDYKILTKNLFELTELLGVEEKYDFANSHQKNLYQKLNEIKLWEGYQKLRASHLITTYKQSNKLNIDFEYGIHNQKATIDFIIRLKDDYTIGIQLEDNQFRKFITGKNYTEFAEKLRTGDLFFDSKWISPRKYKMLTYKPDFKYQYEKIEIQSFKDLFKKIENEMKKIINSKKEIEAKIPLK